MPAAIPILVGTAVASTAASIYSSEKSRSQQRKAARKQENLRKRQSARDSMAQVRQARIAQAQVLQGAGTQGTMSSSAAQGGYSAIGALTGGNMQFINQIDSMNSAIARNMEKANQYAGQASTFNAVSNLAMMGASMMTPASPSQLQNTGLVKGSQVSTTGNASGVATTAYTANLGTTPWG